MTWLRHWWLRVTGKKDSTLSEIRALKAIFEESVMAAQAAGSPYNQTVVEDVLARFNQLENELGHAKTRTQIEALVEQADGLTTLRAYICPQKEIEIRGLTAISTLEDWSIPNS